MRKLTLVLLVGLLVLGIPAAAQDTDPWVCPDGYQGQTLNIFNWSTYIAEDTIPNFEEACGVTVNYDVYDSDDSLINRLREGNPGYDIIVPSNLGLPTLIREELVIPLDYDLIPNAANIADVYRDTMIDPGDVYSVFYLAGTIGLGYDKTVITDNVTSWGQFFEHDGPIAWIDDSRFMFALGMLMTGRDPNSFDAEDLQAAKDFLIANSDNVITIATDDGQELLARGEVEMVIEYSGDILQLNLDCECEDFVYVVPDEGTAASTGHIAIPAGAQNPALANVFIDYLLDPQISADIANYTAYPTPNQRSIDLGLIDEALINNPGIYPDADTLARVFFQMPNPDADDMINNAWDEVKIALSR
ncbi:MAG: spermidine/putrescine ABC transporter substrate-binding protein [Anaerolineae bacterium]|nr:spermidine/putrescine ABC transporter substrate-binding protein [Anaerolineae bacterium]